MAQLIIIRAQKEPKTKAKLLAEKHPRTRVPDSEIWLGNIIARSPMYIPYKRIPKCQKGKGKFGKKLTFPSSSGLEMPHHRRTPTQQELLKAA